MENEILIGLIYLLGLTHAVCIDDGGHSVNGILGVPIGKDTQLLAVLPDVGNDTEDARYYICNSKYVSASCDGVGAIQADDIEDIVFDEMSRKLKEFNELSYTEKQGDTAELTKLKIRLEEIEKEIATLIDKIVSASEATMEYINKRVDALDEEKKKLREKVSQLSAEMYDRKNIGVISGYMNNWENVSMDDKLSVVDALIETIRVGHGKVQISWKI